MTYHPEKKQMRNVFNEKSSMGQKIPQEDRSTRIKGHRRTDPQKVDDKQGKKKKGSISPRFFIEVLHLASSWTRSPNFFFQQVYAVQRCPIFHKTTVKPLRSIPHSLLEQNADHGASFNAALTHLLSAGIIYALKQISLATTRVWDQRSKTRTLQQVRPFTNAYLIF